MNPGNRTRVSVGFAFSAYRRIEGLPNAHPQSQYRGVDYEVTASVTGHVVDPGLVADYAEFDPVGKYIDDNLDRRILNQVLDFNPTPELLAAHLLEAVIDQLAKSGVGHIGNVAVTVSEFGGRSATVDRDIDYASPAYW